MNERAPKSGCEVVPSPDALIAQWHSDAENLRAWGAGEWARVLERCAEQLADALAEREDETLTLAEAAAHSGYSVSHLRRLIAHGTLRDVAETGASRVRRGDLPRKPGYHPTAPPVLRVG